ncbi:MAG TPA: hypothetical protein VN457_04460, partial [Chlamydiales bacterium]|nr:hypothetical protein [Chlamydiales bacterium]
NRCTSVVEMPPLTALVSRSQIQLLRAGQDVTDTEPLIPKPLSVCQSISLGLSTSLNKLKDTISRVRRTSLRELINGVFASR